MVMEKEKFVNYGKDTNSSVMSLKMNSDKRKLVDEMKQKLRQPKDATVMWQCMEIAKVVLDGSEGHVLEMVLQNLRKNQRLGIIEYL